MAPAAWVWPGSQTAALGRSSPCVLTRQLDGRRSSRGPFIGARIPSPGLHPQGPTPPRGPHVGGEVFTCELGGGPQTFSLQCSSYKNRTTPTCRTKCQSLPSALQVPVPRGPAATSFMWVPPSKPFSTHICARMSTCVHGPQRQHVEYFYFFPHF